MRRSLRRRTFGIESERLSTRCRTGFVLDAVAEVVIVDPLR